MLLLLSKSQLLIEHISWMTVMLLLLLLLLLHVVQ
jgi:hypothetical protein